MKKNNQQIKSNTSKHRVYNNIVEETISKIYNQSLALQRFVEVLIVDSNTNSFKISIEKYKNKSSFLKVNIIKKT